MERGQQGQQQQQQQYQELHQQQQQQQQTCKPNSQYDEPPGVGSSICGA